jgi:hypothetical protein
MASFATFIQYFYESWNPSARTLVDYRRAVSIASQRTGISVGSSGGQTNIPGLPTYDELTNEGPVATNPPDPQIPPPAPPAPAAPVQTEPLSPLQVQLPGTVPTTVTPVIAANTSTVVEFEFVAEFEIESQTWGIWNQAQGRFVETGFATRSGADARIQELSVTGVELPVPRVTAPVPAPVQPNLSAAFDYETQTWGVWNNDEGRFVVTGLTRAEADAQAAGLDFGAIQDAELDAAIAEAELARLDAELDAATLEAEQQRATVDALRAQAAINERRRQANQGDWRVKLQLAPNASYLYKARPTPGILQPLSDTDGVVFPYTPKIDLSYRAMYDTASLTHANYNSYFYKGSMLDPVNVTATFTAQDTAEANYLLAVIHFFRSVTKMFYGQDRERGAPPPLVYITGLGEYQFFNHPCVVHQFNYSLPSDVDYIRARSIMDPGTNLQNRRARSAVATTPLEYTLKRLASLGQNINQGATSNPPPPPTLGQRSPTYVPTRIDISLILYPIQSRSQVSQQFSLAQYANGDLLKGGFW